MCKQCNNVNGDVAVLGFSSAYCLAVSSTTLLFSFTLAALIALFFGHSSWQTCSGKEPKKQLYSTCSASNSGHQLAGEQSGALSR